MQIDLSLIEKIKMALEELAPIAQQDIYDKSFVLDKIKTITEDLEKINTISSELLKEYKQDEHRMIDDMKTKNKSFKKYNEEVAKAVDELIAEAEEIRTTKGRPSNQRKRIFDWSESNLEAMKNAITFDTANIGKVLHNYTLRHFASQRKRWLWWSNKIFYYRIFIAKFFTILFCASVAFGFKKILGHLISIPEYLIFLIVAVLLFFSLDKYAEKKYEVIFWRRVRKHVLLLHYHFNLYLEHIKIMLNNRSSR